jgi:cytochrome P450
LLADAREGGAIELVGRYAEPLSLAVMCDLLGIPAGERAGLVPLSHRIVSMYEPDPPDARAADANAAAGTMRALMLDLVRERRRRNGDDLLAALVAARVDGEGLTDDQIASTAMVLLMAGHEATVNATGNGVAALAAHPGEWARVVNGEVAPRTAVEEVLRFDPPLQLFERWVLEPGVALGGVELPVGARVAMLLGSANRDPRRFPEPDRFDIGRGDTGHVSFGGGIHFCVGAPLARLELETTLGLLARTLPRLELASTPERRGGFQFRGFARLAVAG